MVSATMLAKLARLLGIKESQITAAFRIESARCALSQIQKQKERNRKMKGDFTHDGNNRH